MQYTETLMPIDCSLDDDSEHSMDFGLVHMNKSELAAYDAYKKQPIGPFKLVYKENMGYDVVAGKNLPSNMIICEYIGDVVTLRSLIKQEQDQ
jgi:hypothetical protein